MRGQSISRRTAANPVARAGYFMCIHIYVRLFRLLSRNQPRDPFCDRQAGREAGRLDSEQVDQAGNAMIFLGLNEKIGLGPARPGNLWSDSTKGRLQRAVRQSRPVGSDGGIERVGAVGIEVVVDLVHPLHVRPEPCLSGKVEGEMNAEPAWGRNRIDQARKGRPFRESEIISLAEIE